MPIKFYRIEDYNQNGPYRWEAWAFCARWDEERNPGPERDGLGYIDVEEYFGFRNLEELTAWFERDELESLIEDPISVPWKFRISVYEVDEAHVRHGKKQAVARKPFMVYRETIDIKELIT